MNIKDKPLRVLQVVGAMNYGGVESMLINLHRHIDREIVQFDYLVRNNEEGKHDKEIVELGGNIYRIKPFNGLNPIAYYRECLDFYENHKELSVIHGHIGSSAALYLSAAKKSGIYTIAHSHNANTHYDLRNIAYSFFSFPTRYIADSLFACSTEAGVSRFGSKACGGSNFYLFHNAIDLNLYSYDHIRRDMINREFNFSKDDIVIGAVGRISEQKNPDYMLDIFENAVRQNSNVKCLWIGTGDQLDYYRSRILNDNLSSRIIMTGARSDVPDLLQRIDAYIMPSLYEGLPVSAVEAQASGLPCILSENISKETEISGLVSWMSINTSPSDWASKAIDLALENREKRSSPINEVTKAGYNINTTTEWLTAFYLEHAKHIGEK